MRRMIHQRRARILPAALALALLPAALALEARPQAPIPPASPAAPPALQGPAVIPRFPRAVNPIALRGPARPERYMEASGHKAAFLGREDGSFEAWVYPMKVLHDFRLSFGVAAYADPIPGASLATDVDVRPEASTVRYAHASFTVDATWLVPMDEQGGVVLLDVTTSEPLTVIVKFRIDLKPMWPAGLGGQYSYWDGALKAYVAGEGSRKASALIGSPFAVDPPEQPAHNLPDAPSQFAITITPETAAKGLVPIVIASSVENFEATKAQYQKLLTNTAFYYRDAFGHYVFLREEMTSIDTPDDRLDLAFEWGKVALDKGVVCNPHLGCGLIAGLGPSGTSERPGFGWYFGGDAFINSWAMTAYGDFGTVKQALEFLRKRQRADGKMMHELSQGAGFIRWFEDYSYGYYHADTTPLYLIAVRDYVRASGDTAMAKDFWPSMKKAYEYCLSTDEDGDGLMDNTKAGAAAVETGALRRRDVLTDVFLGAAWTEAAEAAAELAELSGDPLAATARAAAAKARASLNTRFLDDPGKRIYFAWMKDGKGQAEPTVWPGFGLWRGVFDPSRPAVAGALDDLAGAGVGADWGARMLSIDSALYEPLSYNNGASWPFLTGFAALALYANGRPDAAWAYLDGTADLTFLESRGYMAELFSGDRLRSIDAAVPHQLFATTGFVSTVMRGLVGLNVARAENRDGQALPDRLVVAPQLPAGWGYLRVRNLRWRGATLDVGVTRDEFGTSVAVNSRYGTVPLEYQALMSPGAVTVKARTTKGWKPLGPQDNPRGPRMWRFDEIYKPEKFSLEALPGIEVVPVQAPLQLGDVSSRLRIIDAWTDGKTYKLKVEGRRGRSYQLRMFIPFKLTTMELPNEVPPLQPGASAAVRTIRVDMPPADPATTGPVLKRTDWATQVITVQLGDRLR
jgi:glycogen debranching enzyme